MATSACSSSSLALLMVVMAYAATGALAATYVVGGDNQQWTTIPGNPTAYTDWASRQRFVVGDTLVFTFPTNFHNVLQVSRADFENCNAQNPIVPYMSGPATVNLNSSGAYYFICGVGVHCSQLRQRMTLTVAVASSPAPPPTAEGPTVGTPPSTTATPPPTSTPSVPSSPAPPPTTGGPTVGTPPPSTTATPPPTSNPSVPFSPRPTGAASSNGHGKAAIAAVALTACVAALVL